MKAHRHFSPWMFNTLHIISYLDQLAKDLKPLENNLLSYYVFHFSTSNPQGKLETKQDATQYEIFLLTNHYSYRKTIRTQIQQKIQTWTA